MSNKIGMRWIGIGALALGLPLAASAQQAFTRGTTYLRAGPASDYPSVARLAPGQPLTVIGCTGGYGWCDVALPDGLRGWAPANRLDYPYGGASVPLASYGATIGVPIIAFSIGNYWGNYYRDRPWYNERRWWGGRPPPPPVPGWRPLPPPHAGWQPRPPAPGFVSPPRPVGPGYGRPGYNPGHNPGHNPGYNPGHNPGYNPGYNPRPDPGHGRPVDPGYHPPRPGPGRGPAGDNFGQPPMNYKPDPFPPGMANKP